MDIVKEVFKPPLDEWLILDLFGEFPLMIILKFLELSRSRTGNFYSSDFKIPNWTRNVKKEIIHFNDNKQLSTLSERKLEIEWNNQ